MTLHEFLALDHRFKWSGYGFSGRAEIYNDCITFPATWVHHRTAIDVVSQFRGTYHSKEEAAGIIEAAGGLVNLAEQQLALAAAKRVQEPCPGDVGVIVAPTGTAEQTLIGAIRFGPLWAFLTPGRVVAKQAECVAAWSIPGCA